MVYKIRRSFTQCRDGELVNIAERVVQGFNNNTDLPNPPQTSPALQQAYDEYRVALASAAKRDRAMVAIKNSKRVVLISVLASFADYVDSVAKDNKALLISSGFDCAREKRSEGFDSIPDLEVLNNSEHEVTIRCNRVVGAKTYLYEYTTDPLDERSWKQKATTERTITISDLASDVKYWFRVRVVGYGGKTVQSPTVARYIL